MADDQLGFDFGEPLSSSQAPSNGLENKNYNSFEEINEDFGQWLVDENIVSKSSAGAYKGYMRAIVDDIEYKYRGHWFEKSILAFTKAPEQKNADVFLKTADYIDFNKKFSEGQEKKNWSNRFSGFNRFVDFLEKKYSTKIERYWSNAAKISFWKGGEASDIFDPFELKDCLIGVTTKGRAVYDCMKSIELIAEEQCKDYGAGDEKLEAAREMLNADILRHTHSKNGDKVPLFCQTEYKKDDLFVDYPIEEPYNFPKCSLGTDFMGECSIFSLSDMAKVLVGTGDFTKETAVKYIYSLELDDNQIVVDDLFERIDING